MQTAPLRINVAQLGMVVVATVLALLATAFHAVSVLAIVRSPECVALDPSALAGHRLVLALAAGAVVTLWMTAGWILFATRRPPIQVVLALVALAAAVMISVPVGEWAADRWSGGDTERATCWGGP